MHTTVDEIIFGGQVLETSSTEVMKVVEEISKCYHCNRILTWFLYYALLLNMEALHHSIKLVSYIFLNLILMHYQCKIIFA